MDQPLSMSRQRPKWVEQPTQPTPTPTGNHPTHTQKRWGPLPNRSQTRTPTTQKLLRQSPTLPQPPSCSTISANGLSYRDRNG